MGTKIRLDDIRKLCVAYTTTELLPVTSVEFLYTGECLLFNTEQDIKYLRLTNERVQVQEIAVKKYGAGLSRFYSPQCLVHTSVKDDVLRLLSIGGQKYLRYLPGHSATVVSVSVSSDHIASGSRDKSIRLWDPRQSPHIERREFPSTPLVAFHPSSAVIAVAHSSSTIETYSTKFMTRSIEKAIHDKIDGEEWVSLKFSDNGLMLMVTTNATSIRIFDALTLQELHNFRGKTTCSVID